MNQDRMSDRATDSHSRPSAPAARAAAFLLAGGLALAWSGPAVAQSSAPGAGATGLTNCAESVAPSDVPPETPVIAIVVDGLSDAPPEAASGSPDTSAADAPGLNGLAKRFLALPPPVAFTVDPRAPEAETLIEAIRAAGHEALLRLPIAPTRHDPRGPETPPRPSGRGDSERAALPMLHSALAPEENLDRMERALTSLSGFVGVFAGAGAPITANAAVMKPLLLSLKRENCLLIDGRGSNRSIVSLMARRLKTDSAPVADRVRPGASRREVYAKLERIANGAGKGQGVILLAHADTATLFAIRGWLGHRVTTQTRLAPVSVAARRAAPTRW